MCVFIVFLLFCPHCFSFSLWFLCLLFCYLYEAQFFVFDFILFSINVFPIILVIIIIILSTTFFSIICKWTTFASKDECQRQSCDVSAIFVVVVLLGSVHALEAKIIAPNWDANSAAPTPRKQLNLSCQAEARARATGLQDCEVIKFIYFCFFLLCLFLLNVEVPNYIIKFLLAFASLFVLFYFLVFLRGFNYIKLWLFA